MSNPPKIWKKVSQPVTSSHNPKPIPPTTPIKDKQQDPPAYTSTLVPSTLDHTHHTTVLISDPRQPPKRTSQQIPSTALLGPQPSHQSPPHSPPLQALIPSAPPLIPPNPKPHPGPKGRGFKLNTGPSHKSSNQPEPSTHILAGIADSLNKQLDDHDIAMLVEGVDFSSSPSL